MLEMMMMDWTKVNVGDVVDFVDMIEKHVPAATPMPSRWYVLQTWPGKEAKVMQAFEDRGISAYWPLLRKTALRRGRKIDVVEPLFAQLIFLPDFQVYDAAVNAMMHIEGVQGLLQFGEWTATLPERAPDDRPAAAPQGRYVRRSTQSIPDMAGVRELEQLGNMPVARKRRLFKAGQLVRVVDGPFSSFKGVIERLDSRGRLAVLLNVFARMTPVEFEEGQIEAVLEGNATAPSRFGRKPIASVATS